MEQKRGRGKERGNKKGRGNKNFKKGGKLDQGVGALKREGGGGLEPPYKLWCENKYKKSCSGEESPEKK